MPTTHEFNPTIGDIQDRLFLGCPNAPVHPKGDCACVTISKDGNNLCCDHYIECNDVNCLWKRIQLWKEAVLDHCVNCDNCRTKVEQEMNAGKEISEN